MISAAKSGSEQHGSKALWEFLIKREAFSVVTEKFDFIDSQDILGSLQLPKDVIGED